MKSINRLLGGLAAVVALLGIASATLAADRPYKEGVVVNVTRIRTEPGMFDEYMKYLAGPYRQLMDEQKKAGIVVDYAFYAAVPQRPDDADLYLITTYKNMAALDDLDAKTDPITEKVMGDLARQNSDTAARGKVRTILGNELLRKLDLK
jgi:hypothetical protein